jgi:hypothetical protein
LIDRTDELEALGILPVWFRIKTGLKIPLLSPTLLKSLVLEKDPLQEHFDVLHLGELHTQSYDRIKFLLLARHKS